MILNESTTSMMMPWYYIVLYLTKLLKTQVIFEYLILRLILHKINFKGLFLLKSFISHNQKCRHVRALGNLWLMHWLIIPVMRHSRAFSMMKSFRGFLESFHSHLLNLSSYVLHGSKKDLRELLLLIFTSR